MMYVKPKASQALNTRHPLAQLVCGQLCRSQYTTMKEVMHGCGRLAFNGNGAAIIPNEDRFGDYIFYSAILHHADNRALTDEELSRAQSMIETVLNQHQVAHSIACVDSHYDLLVKRRLRASENERFHPDADPEHLDHLAHKYAAQNHNGLSQVSFRIPNTEVNALRLMQAMSEINEVAPRRDQPGRTRGNH